MAGKAKVCIIRTDGTNCDRETKHGFGLVGGQADIIHMNSLIRGYDPAVNKKVDLDNYDILVIPGGFSNGDYISAGKILAEDLQHFLGDKVNRFVEKGKPVIGICNGFQVLVKYGLLPMIYGEVKQSTTLTTNDSKRFECRWINLIKPDYATQKEKDKCIWTKGIQSIDLPVAKGEGKFVASASLINKLFNNNQVVFQYADSNSGNPTMEYPANPSGSMSAIAGICNPSGTVFGLMPHPERYRRPESHPLAGLQKRNGNLPEKGLGLQIFKNAVEFVK